VWAAHPGWRRGFAPVNRFAWRSGHWWHGVRGRRFGWWWIVGPAWYWYPAAVYPYPDLYSPPYLVPGYWYWCDFYEGYYPDVADCPTGWQPYAPQ
jgi:hypothetical protein